MSTENKIEELDYFAFFSNDVTGFLTQELSDTVKDAIKISIKDGNLNPAVPISVTVDKDSQEITLLNVMLEEVDLNVVPGSVSLPSNYQATEGKVSLAADPIWSAHMEDVWGF